MLDRYPQPEDWYRVRFSDEAHFGYGPEGQLSYELFESRVHENVLIVFNIGLLRQRKRKIESAYIFGLRSDTISNLTFISMASQAIRTEK